MLAVDSRSGRGLEELRVALDAMLAAAPLAADRGRPRLWVDRVFAAKGAGTVVTGTMAGGTLPLDAEVLILPGRKRAREWLDEPVPALANQTPREAAATPIGRERLEALFSEYQWRTEEVPPHVRPDIRALRQKLGV